MKAIAYMRVSTKAQGKSGLGLEAQKERIERFIREMSGEFVAEYVDVVSGTKDGREQLKKAMAHVKKIDGTLIIAKLDRISRKVSFIASLMESGVRFAVAEMPNATAFQLHIYAALAEEERRLISERTKAALNAAKIRGVQLGQNGKSLAARNKQRADAFAKANSENIRNLYTDGNSYNKIAKILNDSNALSFTGGLWHAITVQRILKRL